MSLKTSIVLRLQNIRKKFQLSWQEGLSLVLFWPVAAIIIGTLGWVALLNTLEREREQVENAWLQQAAVLARAYADQLSRTLNATDRLVLYVRQEWQSNRGLRLEDRALAGLFPSASTFFIGITDKEGNLVTSSIPGEEKINVADRPYFAVQRDSPTDFLYFGTPPSARVVNSNVIQFSRKLRDAQGNFAGIVMAAVSPSHLTDSYDDSALGNNGYLGIIGRGNDIRVSRTGKTIRAPAFPLLFTIPTFDSLSGYMLMRGDRWFTDGRSRFVGWQAVSGYPVIALTGLDAQDKLTPLLQRQATSRRLAFGATAALALFTVVATMLSLRLATRKRQLRVMQATYRKATEESSEGFYIARPFSSPQRATTDYRIVDCNQYGAELFGLRRTDLIGSRISSLELGAASELLLARLHEAMTKGVHETEIRVPADVAIRPRWLHFKAVRSEGNIAVTLRDISHVKEHLQELERRSNEDDLTGLPNRHWARNYLPHAIERATQDNMMLAVLYVDLDGFKNVNDTMGHAAGDELLQNAARRLKLAVRPHDHVVRLGGDEFMLILEHVASAEEIAPVANRVLQAFRQSFRLTQGVHSVGTSIGIGIFPNDGADADTLLRHADIAMYAVKTAGKANYRFFDPTMYEALRLRLQRESELRQAIETDQFVMHYQPRIDLATDTTSSMESLVRWNHPVHGLTGPNEFIPLAEETGLILGLGALIIDKVIAQLAAWSEADGKMVPVSINVSPRQFRESDVTGLFSAALARHRINAALVEIEVTESSMMGNSEEVTKALSDLQKMGIKLLVDDFGTGYSSLSQLQQLDFDVLKVDRAFTSKIDCSDEGNVFFKAIVTMAHALGMRVVAEGVENEEQVRILKFLHCDELQGFFISNPLPATDTQPILPRQFSPQPS